MDYDLLSTLRRHHPAWRLLAADTAPFVIGFLYDCFIRPNVRALSEEAITPKLEDHLHQLRERLAGTAPTGSAREYLHDWADNAKGWLRRYYPLNSDEPYYDLTPAAERAIHWLTSLEQRQFIGAESRLKLVFELLRQIAEGSETDPQLRIAELTRRRELMEAEIDRIRAGPSLAIGSDPAPGALPPGDRHGPRSTGRLSASGADFPRSRSPGARTDHGARGCER